MRGKSRPDITRHQVRLGSIPLRDVTPKNLLVFLLPLMFESKGNISKVILELQVLESTPLTDKECQRAWALQLDCFFETVDLIFASFLVEKLMKNLSDDAYLKNLKRVKHSKLQIRYLDVLDLSAERRAMLFHLLNGLYYLSKS